MIDGYQKAIKLATIEIDLAITGGKLLEGCLKEFRNIFTRESSPRIDRTDDLETLSRQIDGAPPIAIDNEQGRETSDQSSVY